MLAWGIFQTVKLKVVFVYIPRFSVRCESRRETTQKFMLKFIGSVVLLVRFCVVKATTNTPPHIIIFVLDDFGYHDVSYAGGNIPTPYMDELSAAGVRLERYYTHTLCTPSRMALLTGKYSHLSGFGSGSVLLYSAPYSLPPDTKTLPKELRSRGYRAHAAGKWHLGSTRFKDTPTGRSWGFESFLGFLHDSVGHYSKIVGVESEASAYYDFSRYFPNGSWVPEHDDRHATRCITDEALRVLETHAETRKDEPLFLYVAYSAAHVPLQADPEWMQHCSHLPHHYRRDLCGLIYGTDEGIRNVTLAAQRLLGDNIVVVVTSDNGGMLHEGSLNTPLRGSKWSGFEGGVRTVGFVTDLTRDSRYLAKGTTYSGLLHIADWMPTILSIVDDTRTGIPRRAPHSEHKLGYGYNMQAALRTGSASPRTDAVLVLDEHTNFISYLKPPYKLLIGHMGNGRWNAYEPQGRYLYENASLLEMFEEEFKYFLDWVMGTRDLTTKWKTLLHTQLQRLRLLASGNVDFFNAGEVLLGKESVLSDTAVPLERIPLLLFDVYEDPGEHKSLTLTHPEVLEAMLASFNEHWKVRPPQFNWVLTCLDETRFRIMPEGMCGNRTSHKYPEPNRKSCSNRVPCRFEGPYIGDDDPSPCGEGRSPPVDFKAQKVSTMLRIGAKFLGVAVLLTVALLCCWRYRSKKKEKTA